MASKFTAEDIKSIATEVASLLKPEKTEEVVVEAIKEVAVDCELFKSHNSTTKR